MTTLRRSALFKPVALTVLGLAIAGSIGCAVLFGLPLVRAWTQPAAGADGGGVGDPRRALGVERIAGATDTIEVPDIVSKKLKLETLPVADPKPRLLELRGSLTFDPQQLARIKSRFAGEVIHVEEVRDPLACRAMGESVLRPLRPGDCVKKGDRLAVVWSKELGEKKSELVDALSQLYLDQETLKRFEKGADVIPEQRLLEQRRQVESDLVAADKARRTLESWRLSDEEIKDIEAEAQRVRERGGKRDPEKKKNWPRVDILAPLDGVIVEKNVVAGDYVADSTFDLFKVANIDRLALWAHAYEEDLPALQTYEKQMQDRGEALPWKIRVRSDANSTPVAGTVTRIGLIVDPAQHTIIVEGTVDNKDHRLRAGENITATIALPPAAGELTIPISALVEDGKTSIVFVESAKNLFTMRQVRVTRRGLDKAQIQLGPVQKGDRVVSSSAIELSAALEDLPSK